MPEVGDRLLIRPLWRQGVREAIVTEISPSGEYFRDQSGSWYKLGMWNIVERLPDKTVFIVEVGINPEYSELIERAEDIIAKALKKIGLGGRLVSLATGNEVKV